MSISDEKINGVLNSRQSITVATEVSMFSNTSGRNMVIPSEGILVENTSATTTIKLSHYLKNDTSGTRYKFAQATLGTAGTTTFPLLSEKKIIVPDGYSYVVQTDLSPSGTFVVEVFYGLGSGDFKVLFSNVTTDDNDLISNNTSTSTFVIDKYGLIADHRDTNAGNVDHYLRKISDGTQTKIIRQSLSSSTGVPYDLNDNEKLYIRPGYSLRIDNQTTYADNGTDYILIYRTVH